MYGSTLTATAYLHAPSLRPWQNDLLVPIHNQMPVILARELKGFWLDSSVEDLGALVSGLTPRTDGAMEAYEVSTLVNPVANDGPEVVARRQSVA